VLDRLVRLVCLLSVHLVGEHDDLESDAAELDRVANLYLVSLVDEVARVVLCVLDDLPDLARWRLPLLLEIINRPLVVYPVVACSPQLKGTYLPSRE
jgi:hypothetical protein